MARLPSAGCLTPYPKTKLPVLHAGGRPGPLKAADAGRGLRVNKSIPTRILCPKQSWCNASYCPLVDAGLHLKNEVVCAYLLESVKLGGTERVKERLPPEVAAAVVRHSDRVWNTPRPRELALQAALKRASLSASRMEMGTRLNPVAA